MSIHNLNEKIKSFNQDYKSLFLNVFTILITSFGSFFLGRLSIEPSKQVNSGNYAIDQAQLLSDQKANALESVSDTEENATNQDQNYYKKTKNISNAVNKKEGKYFASKNGKIYYPVGCKSGDRIKSANRVYFKDSKSAEYVGYKKNKTCKY